MDQALDESAAPSASLFRELKAVWNLGSLEEFVRTANSSPDFAALLPAIISTADAGDELAQHVLEQAAVELSQLASVVIRRLFAESSAGSTLVRLAMVGGVFRHSTRVRQHFSDEVRKFDPRVQVIQEIVEPVAGALQMARRAHTKSK
jgi:N-acetylglucosamine kinase-like BadF-type ATPase